MRDAVGPTAWIPMPRGSYVMTPVSLPVPGLDQISDVPFLSPGQVISDITLLSFFLQQHVDELGIFYLHLLLNHANTVKFLAREDPHHQVRIFDDAFLLPQ